MYSCRYYPLEVSYFKSTLDSHILDLLWNKYWVNTLSSNPLLTVSEFNVMCIADHYVKNRDYTGGQISDLAEKLEQAETQLAHSGRMGGFFMPEKKKEESQLSKLTRDRYICIVH